MSNKTEKQARKANILTLGVSDLAPIVGSIIADKDAIIIKKMPNGGAAVFFSDQNGNVITAETETESNSKYTTMKTKVILTKNNTVATLVKNNNPETAIIVKGLTVYSKYKNRKITLTFLGEENPFVLDYIYNDNYVRNFGMNYNGHHLFYGKDLMVEMNAQELVDDDKIIVIVDYELI